jgi:hypothetical protein
MSVQFSLQYQVARAEDGFMNAVAIDVDTQEGGTSSVSDATTQWWLLRASLDWEESPTSASPSRAPAPALPAVPTPRASSEIESLRER